MTRLFSLYRQAFSGLSEPAWMLAVVMFINRCGAMVLPFLSVYLTEFLHFTVPQVGITMSLFGLGSMGGAFLGGWLTDRIGHFRVQVGSLFVGGGLFFLLLELQQFSTFAGGIFLLSLVTECLRPANSASVSFYTDQKNVTRAFSLNRMAINLGFSIGPALGGLLATISYHWLFLADGISSLLAGIFFYVYFRHRTGYTPRLKTAPKAVLFPDSSPYRDRQFMWFAVLCGCFGLVFFQFFTNLPLYYRQVYALPQTQVGTLFALNGVVVFSLEMVVVYLVGNRYKLAHLVTWGTLCVGLSFALLNILQGVWVLYLAMFVLSIAEILAMPFLATIPVKRSDATNRGAYMGVFTLSYSVAFVIGPYLGTSIISEFGFAALWWFTAGLATLTALGLFWLVSRMEKNEV